MDSPQVQGHPALHEKLVALVDSCDARDRAALMIEDLVCHVRSNAEPSHARYTCPTQIVEPPLGHIREPIKHPFSPAKIMKWPRSKNREHERPRFLCPIEHCDRLLGQMNHMLLAILGPRAG